MNGYILFNRRGDTFSRRGMWEWGQGWILTEQEKDKILAKTKNWQSHQNPPTHYQAARLEGENVVLIGDKIPV